MLNVLTHVISLTRAAIKNITTKRSSAWPKVEKTHLAKYATCAACGGKSNLNVHHIIPFHLNPSLELDPANLITLCMSINHHCHLLLGHGDDFKAYNPSIVADAAGVRLHPKTFKLAASWAKITRRYEARV